MPPIRSEEPTDRLTRICSAMTSAMEAHPEYAEDTDKAMIFLSGDARRMGLVLHGYDDDVEAMAHLIIHLQAIFEANGRKLIVMPLGRG